MTCVQIISIDECTTCGAGLGAGSTTGDGGKKDSVTSGSADFAFPMFAVFWTHSLPPRETRRGSSIFSFAIDAGSGRHRLTVVTATAHRLAISLSLHTLHSGSFSNVRTECRLSAFDRRGQPRPGYFVICCTRW